MIVGCLHLHACGGPLGMAQSTQLAPLQLIALGGMLDDVGGSCKQPFTLFIVGTTTALFGSTIAVAPPSTTAPTNTTAPTTTTTQQLHLVELKVGLGKVGSKHGDYKLGGHQISPGASGLLGPVDQLQGLKDFIMGHLPLVVGRASCNELVAKHFLVVPGKLVEK
jgi:hypothetical protein